VLRKYVREERRMTLEETIRKFTSLPASRVRLNDGGLKVGLWPISWFRSGADHGQGDLSAPKQLSVGMQWVLVNGCPVIADGVATNALPGRVLSRARLPLNTLTTGSAGHFNHHIESERAHSVYSLPDPHDEASA